MTFKGPNLIKFSCDSMTESDEELGEGSDWGQYRNAKPAWEGFILTWHWGVHEEADHDCSKLCKALCPCGGQISGRTDNVSCDLPSKILQGTTIVLSFLTTLYIAESSKCE